MGARLVVSAVVVVALAGCPAVERSEVIASRVKVDFGVVEADVAPYRLGVALSNPGEKSVRLTELRLEPAVASLSLEGVPVEVLEPGERRLVTVVYAPTQEETVFTELRLDAEDGVGPRVIPVRGQAVRLGGVASVDLGPACPGQPGSLDFGTVTNGSPVSREVTIEATGSGPLIILKASVTPADAGFTVASASPQGAVIEPGAQRTFAVRFDPRAPGAQTGVVRFETNSQRVPRFDVPLCGTGMVSALCAPEFLDLGAVAAGGAASGVITATSCGNLPVDVRAVTLVPTGTGASGMSLVVPPTPRTLQPAETFDVRVDFAATSTHSSRAEVRFATSSPSAPEVPVRVGANLPPPCDVAITPSALELFKDVGWARSVRVTNRGATACVLERVEFVPAAVPFRLERALTLPTVLPPKASLDLNVEYLPSPSETQPVTATLELEFDWTHAVSLKGDPRPPPGCRLVPSQPFIDFGLGTSSTRASRTLGLLNVGKDPCHISSATIDQAQFTVSLRSNTIDPQSSGMLGVEFVPRAGTSGPVQGTLTIASNDADEPRRQLSVVAGHARCDPGCMCTADETLTYWRFSAGYVGSSVHVAATGESAYEQSCDPHRCAAGQVAVEYGRDVFVCAAPPPTCGEGQGLDFFGDGWACVPCALVVQYGSLFDGMRACAPTPTLSCPSGQSPTFEAQNRAWSCVETCNNGQYDRHTLPGGGLVCIPC